MFALLFLFGISSGLQAELSSLPFALNALEPVISAVTVDLHYNKHHAGYVKKLNKILSSGENFSPADSIESLVLLLKREKEEWMTDFSKTREKAYNFASQVLAHDLYWQSLSPKRDQQPMGRLADAMVKDFGGFEGFKKEFTAAAAGHFGSGWVTLYATKSGSLIIKQNHDTGLLYNFHMIPILTVDVWEHAYYVDYQNRRGEYLEKYWSIVNWKGVQEKFDIHVDSTKNDL